MPGIVLYAEDNQLLREFFVEDAQKAGLNIEAFASAEALAARYDELRKSGTKPLAIVTDNQLSDSTSDMTGVDLARKIRTQDRYTPIFLMSSSLPEQRIIASAGINKAFNKVDANCNDAVIEQISESQGRSNGPTLL